MGHSGTLAQARVLDPGSPPRSRAYTQVVLVWLEWFDRLRLWALLGVIGVILLVEGDVTARIIGSVMVVV